MMDDLICKTHKIDLEHMGGRNAHFSNWYCPKCDADKVVRDQFESWFLRLDLDFNKKEDLCRVGKDDQYFLSTTKALYAQFLQIKELESKPRQCSECSNDDEDLALHCVKCLNGDGWFLLGPKQQESMEEFILDFALSPEIYDDPQYLIHPDAFREYVAGAVRNCVEVEDRLRGQLQNCASHLEGVKRQFPSLDRKLNKAIESANKCLYETLNGIGEHK